MSHLIFKPQATFAKAGNSQGEALAKLIINKDGSEENLEKAFPEIRAHRQQQQDQRDKLGAVTTKMRKGRSANILTGVGGVGQEDIARISATGLLG